MPHEKNGLGSSIVDTEVFTGFRTSTHYQDFVDALNGLQCFEDVQKWLDELQVNEIEKAYVAYQQGLRKIKDKLQTNKTDVISAEDVQNLENLHTRLQTHLYNLRGRIRQKYSYFTGEGKIVPNRPSIFKRYLSSVGLVEPQPNFKGNGVWRGNEESPDYHQNEQADFLRALDAFQMHIDSLLMTARYEYLNIKSITDIQLQFRRMSFNLQVQAEIAISKRLNRIQSPPVYSDSTRS